MRPSDVSHLFRIAACMCLAVGLAACKPQGGATTDATSRALPSEEKLASLPLGDIAGSADGVLSETIANPYEGNKDAITEGHKLFIAMNCAGCHGYDASGGMGPDLTDAYWRYGGTPAAIYQSIFKGRPQGMPAWGRALPPQQIWKIVAFVETLGGSVAPQSYHAGIQGDHNVNSVAPEVHDLGPMFNRPRNETPTDDASPPAPPSRSER